MNYEEAVNYFLDIPRFAAKKHDLSGLRRFLEELGNPDRRFKIIHVAGTNGKGSVCAFLESILREQGMKTAAFTSPHLVRVNERFRFDGESVDDGTFLEAFLAVRQAAEKLEREGVSHPTFFEFAFLMFMVMCKTRAPQWVILETGMGGRLDATNVIEKPKLTVITSVSLDHMQYLGPTVEAIAGEKAGILKRGVPVVFDANRPEVRAVIEKRAAGLSCGVYAVQKSWYNRTDMDGESLTMEIPAESRPGHEAHGQQARRSGNSDRVLRLMVPFAAQYQADNAMLAVTAARLFGIPDEIIARGIQKTRWPGRMEQVMPGVFLDGAHNEDGIRAFAAAASRIVKREREQGKGRTVYLLLAISSDKEHASMTRLLCENLPFDVLFVTQVAYGRRLESGILEREASGLTERPVEVYDTVGGALEELLKRRSPGDLIFCAGSLYLIGEIKGELLRQGEIL